MLLTITTTHQPATDLGYLLHKNPARLHSFELSFGQAHVFYPEANAERCTAALLLDVDPVGLVRNRKGPSGERGTLDQYVAFREFALGIEALERFVRKEPLRRVHECVFGVLALESEPVDPRL